jgi:hypothetical protein
MFANNRRTQEILEDVFEGYYANDMPTRVMNDR